MSTGATPTSPDPAVFLRLCAKLDAAGTPYSVLRHTPVYTSEEAAAVRGTPLASGAKALLLNLDGKPALFVLPADRKLNSKKTRQATSVRSLRFATADEVLALTALRPGSIPPFGSLFGLDTYCDPALGLNPAINFNAGDHSISISMAYDDYLRTEPVRAVAISDEPPS